MQLYANKNGQSGVYAFALGSDNIHVKFKTGRTYVYSYSSAGSTNVEQMKGLATGGAGLNTFINTYVKKRYERVY